MVSGHWLLPSVFVRRTVISRLSWDATYDFAGVRCKTPVAPVHGRVSFSGIHHQHVVRYICLKGYSLLGAQQRVCQQQSVYSTEGQWSGVPPKCEGGSYFLFVCFQKSSNILFLSATKCPPLEAPIKGKVVGYRFYYPNSVRYVCDFGYTLSFGAAERNCTASGIWSGSPPSCESTVSYTVVASTLVALLTVSRRVLYCQYTLFWRWNLRCKFGRKSAVHLQVIVNMH